ncbi:MAG: transcription-repair coupling factor [Phycisphaerales bacterium]
MRNISLPLDIITRSPVTQQLAALLEMGGDVRARGAVGSSTSLLTAAITQITTRPCLLVVGHLDEADEVVDELSGLGIENVLRLPALESLPGESSINAELLADRLAVVERLATADQPAILVAPIHALMQTVPAPDRLRDLQQHIRQGTSININALAQWMIDQGYTRVETIDNPGEFAMRGGILDIFSPGADAAVRMDLFGDQVESMWEIDLDTMGSDRRIDSATLLTAKTDGMLDDSDQSVDVSVFLDARTIVILAELIEIHEQGRGYFERLTDARGIIPLVDVIAALGDRSHARLEVSHLAPGTASGAVHDLPVEQLPPFSEDTAEAVQELVELSRELPVVVAAQNTGEMQRLHELLHDVTQTADLPPGIRSMQTYIHRGFIWRDESEGASNDTIAIVPYHELLHRYHARRRVRRIATARNIDTFLDIEPGDLVVHRDHGIARLVAFGHLEESAPSRNRRAPAPTTEEFLTLEFSSNARLHVPAAQIHLVQKYVGGFSGTPKLSALGGKAWKKQKDDVAHAVRELAEDMLSIQAARQTMPGVRYPDDTAWQREFEAAFPYEETVDQLAAIAAVKKDMTSPRPMDRLVCGDVGFGKTEVAIRAAFKAVEYGKQVAVLVPTTVLAEQHEQTFRGRFADFPFRIESISRFKTKKEQTALLKEVANGRVDVIIGTHRLLSKDVKFADLGLLIVDEEQRFGVEHKNRLLQFRMTCDVLTLSATPIPRTLHMSLLGLRDISSLTTPPADRRAIVTEVAAYDKRRIQRALERELTRDGQVFFVHNRVHDIKSVADDVQQLVPDARIVIGHGQMPTRELERVMLTFMRGKADILVSTTIIESGIDIPTANTMIIHDADIFGLSELHQLRGRVGRYKHRAYCYLLLPDDRTMTEAAVKRLRALEDYSMLGAGFKIAMRDLEIRGAGNLLGAEQSGHISAVGYEMYCQLLHQAVEQLKEQRPRPVMKCAVDLNISGSMSRRYIASDQRRLEAYRRLSQADTLEALGRVEHDLRTAYGEPPSSTQTLLELAAISIGAAQLNIRSITRHEGDIVFRTPSPRELEHAMKGAMGSLRPVGTPDANGVMDIYYRPPASYLESATLLAVLRKRLTNVPQRSQVASAPAQHAS